MIVLDRSAPLPVGEQLVQQLRFQIASGVYRPGARVPSTRALGERVGVSFHTVRKAYQKLAEEGVLEVKRGGYRVAEPAPLSKAERLERAATTMQSALQKLVALGLTEDETELVVGEQLAFFERPGGRRRIVFAAPYREMADAGAAQAEAALQERVEGALLGDLRRAAGAEAVITPLPSLADVRRAVPAAEVVGVDVRYPYAALENVARLASSDAVALVTRHGDAAEPLGAVLRDRAGFAGELLSITVEAERQAVDRVVRQAAFVVFTPAARRRVRPLAQRNERPHAEIAPVVTDESIARLRDAVGR